MSENLKLPLCPQCHDTAHVKTSDVFRREYVWNTASYHCNTCDIDWKFPDGIKSRNEGKSDGAMTIFDAVISSASPKYYSYQNIGMGTLDSRCVIDTVKKNV
jgi:hypothetical protein